MPRALSISSSVAFIKKKSLSKRKKRSSKSSNSSLPILLSLLIVGFFFLFLYFNLEIVKINFDLRVRDEELTSLEKEAKRLESRLTEPFSLETLEEKSRELGLVKPEDIRYLERDQGGTLSLEK